MERSVRQAIAVLGSACAGQLGLDDADDPAAVAVAAQAAIERLHAVRAQAVARAEATAAWRVDGAATPTAWARAALGLGTAPAHELVRTARALHRDLPETAAALAAGEVTWAHVTTLTRHALATPARAAAVTAPDGERLLLDVARVATVDQLARALRAWAHTVDPAGFTADEATLYDQRQVTLTQTLDGVRYLHGLLPPAAGAALATVLDAHLATTLGTADPRTPTQVRADTLTDLARLAADADATRAPAAVARTCSSRSPSPPCSARPAAHPPSWPTAETPCPPPPPPPSPATRSSPGCSPTPNACPWAWAAPPAPCPPASGWPSPPATAPAPTPAAPDHPPGATPTTSSDGPTAAPPTCQT
jgi:hypothetical protein